MGIERIVPPAPRVRQPAVEQLSELAGSRAPPKMPQRQRGLWSFLTWPFLIAPIIAAESLLAGNSHASADQDQDDRSPDHGNGHPNATPDHDPAVAGSTHVADDAPRDGTDAMPHAVSFASKAFADANPAHEEHANAPGAHEAAAVPPVPPDDGGSGSIEPEATSSTETSTTSSSGGDTGTGLIGGDPGLGHTVTDVVSTVTGTVSTVVGGVSDVLAPVGSLIGSTVLAPVGDLVGSTVLTPVGSLIGSVDLKSLLGFDLHVNPNGEFVATDLDAVLDHGPLLPVADTVSHAVSPVVDALPMLGLGTSNPLDSLLGGNDHTSGAPLGPSLLGSGGGDDPTALVKGIVSSATPSLEKLADGLLPTPADGHSVLAPVATAASDPGTLNLVGIIGSPTSVTPGHSIDFPSPLPPEGDVLYQGNNYTDYHQALQTIGPSAPSNIDTALANVVSAGSDPASLAHVDSPAPNPPPSSPAAPPPQHQDASLVHLDTALDDLSLRTHTH